MGWFALVDDALQNTVSPCAQGLTRYGLPGAKHARGISRRIDAERIAPIVIGQRVARARKSRLEGGKLVYRNVIPGKGRVALEPSMADAAALQKGNGKLGNALLKKLVALGTRAR